MIGSESWRGQAPASPGPLLPALGAPTLHLAFWHPTLLQVLGQMVSRPRLWDSLILSFSSVRTAACDHWVTSTEGLDLCEPGLLLS